ncbi:MAG: hypothetical protein K5799_11055 [Erythrobacter sp.]|nr:hypothetical protein [Erythrobacter sp.]
MEGLPAAIARRRHAGTGASPAAPVRENGLFHIPLQNLSAQMLSAQSKSTPAQLVLERATKRCQKHRQSDSIHALRDRLGERDRARFIVSEEMPSDTLHRIGMFLAQNRGAACLLIDGLAQAGRIDCKRFRVFVLRLSQ